MGLLDKLRRTVNGLLPKWETWRDTERRGDVIYILHTTTGDYIVKDEGDGSWSWVLVDVESGEPLDLGARLPSADEAKRAAEKDLRGDT